MAKGHHKVLLPPHEKGRKNSKWRNPKLKAAWEKIQLKGGRREWKESRWSQAIRLPPERNVGHSPMRRDHFFLPPVEEEEEGGGESVSEEVLLVDEVAVVTFGTWK